MILDGVAGNTREARQARRRLYEHDIANAPAWQRWSPYVKGFPDNAELLAAVIAQPDDDAPRLAYAAWLRALNHVYATTSTLDIAAFIDHQIRVARLWRIDPRRSVGPMPILNNYVPLRSSLRTVYGWNYKLAYELLELAADGLVGAGWFYRGFVEHVSMQARRFLEVADELYEAAPIRHLTLFGVAEVAAELAASPHLAQIRSLQLPNFITNRDVPGPVNPLTDDVIAVLAASPHLGRLAYLSLENQDALTQAAYRALVTSPHLPQLSCLEVVSRHVTHCEPEYDTDIPRWPRPFARHDEPLVLRYPEDWIAELERALGYVPCVHAEEHYGSYTPDLEAVVEHPIALDPAVMARRFQPIPPLGAKPPVKGMEYPDPLY